MQKNGGLTADIVVVGAGMVGAAIAYGLASRNLRVLVLDGGDRDFRAANANFGLVWLHGKGMDMPAYQRLTRGSLDLWPDFSAELTETTAIDLQYERNGGLAICLGETQFEKRRTELLRLHNQLGEAEPDWEMLDRGELEKLLSKAQLGPDVVGASFGHRDGHANPLRLLAALHVGILRRGGQLYGRLRRQLRANGWPRRVHDRFRIRAGVGGARRDRSRLGLEGACSSGRHRYPDPAATRADPGH
jgi:glycine/D-amino acid oxidase-like deaminating enzyme